MILSSFLLFSCSKVEKTITSLNIVKGTFDMGDVTSDTVVNGYFIVANNTLNTIKYKRILIDCSCTALYLNEGDSILAGKTDTIYCSFNSTGLVNGNVKSPIRVITDTDVDLNRFYIVGTIK
ncbi:MAG: DUF1573 domain-containing protein [Bacteroidales bacterium]|nr:DUF1573 domain-containing protein [Bacteroidales bacterium]